MTAILGLSAFYHDSAAALVVDGELVAAAQEERFSRKKHDASFPKQAVDACLRQAGITIEELDHVGFYEKPLLKFDRLLETYLCFAPLGLRSFIKAMPQWAGQKLRLRREIRRGLDGKFTKRIVFCEHHESHAASAFYPSPFEEAAILTMDGVGEWATTSLGVGKGHRIRIDDEIRFPDSLGLLYSAFTYYTGFRVNSGEYKLMGLAPFGTPKYVDVIRDRLIRLHEDGSFALDLRYFNFCHGLTMTSGRFHRLFGRPPRTPESPIDELDMDLAASIQAITEEVMLRSTHHLHAKSGMERLCLAGGVALNCVANGRLARESPFKHIWIQPAAGDAGGAIGVAMLIWHQLLGKPRAARQLDSQSGSLLGPSYTNEEVTRRLSSLGAVFTTVDDESELCRQLAELLAKGNVVGRLHGRMEFGPRALGNRSILADPRSHSMQSKLNQKIKRRESFRPFAPAILSDRFRDYFDVPESVRESPYMMFTFDVTQSRRRSSKDSGERSLESVCDVRSEIPAVTHLDYSARVQTVDADRNPAFHQLLQAFERLTGCPVLINTSFNVRGEPIVESPDQAYRCFMATDMDALVIENTILRKDDQPESNRIHPAEHQAGFQWD
ncbi:MAG: carbamoyltransferase [Planctomycetota bacterium]